MTSLLEPLQRFWFSPAPASRLALIRLVIGGYALYLLNKNFGFYIRNAATSPSLFEPVGPIVFLSQPLSAGLFQALLYATLVFNILFLLGLGYRMSGPIFGVLLLWMISYRNSWSMIFHTDNLLVLHVLILGFTRSADALSLDSLRRSASGTGLAGRLRGWRARLAQPGWEYGYAIRLLCFVTLLVYFLSGVAKLTGPLGASWAVGESLRAQVAVDVWRKELYVSDAPRIIYQIYDQLWLFTGLGIGTLVLELAAPLVILSGWLAALWVPSALMMHWGIYHIMGIDFPYQLWGVAFTPFIPLDRVLHGIGRLRLIPASLTRLIRLGRKNTPGPLAEHLTE